VIERGVDLLPVEVKSTSSLQYGDAAAVRAFLEEYPNAKTGIVVHLGNEFKQLDDNVYALPFWALI
jgi:predicted AAA+ superfamily ATPase